MILTIQACIPGRQDVDLSTAALEHTSIWCLRSSSTRSFVSLRSSDVSTREATVLILIFCNGAVKSALKEKESVGLTSRPGGCFLSILNFAHASDWRFLCNSASGIAVADLISFMR